MNNVLSLKSNEDGFFKIFFLLFPEDDDFTVLFWSASSDRPCIYFKNRVESLNFNCLM
jgi:hypothetical protein